MKKILNSSDIAATFEGLTEKEYSSLMNIVHELIAEAIVKKAYRFKMQVGTLRVARTRRRRPSINMPETARVKKEILESGGTLYKVLERDKDGNITKDNGGEKYLVYNTSPFYFHWSISGQHIVKKGNKVYKFYPTRGKKGNKELLGRELKENELAKIRFAK